MGLKKIKEKLPLRSPRVPAGDPKDDLSIERGEHLSEENTRVNETRRMHGERMNHGEENLEGDDVTEERVSPDAAFPEATRENETLEP